MQKVSTLIDNWAEAKIARSQMADVEVGLWVNPLVARMFLAEPHRH
jgi:hypothetical protein